MPSSSLRSRTTDDVFSAAVVDILATGYSSKPHTTAAAAPITVKVPVTVSDVAQNVATASTVISKVAGPVTIGTKTVAGTADPATSTEDSASDVPTGLIVGGSGITASNDDGITTINVLSVARKKSHHHRPERLPEPHDIVARSCRRNGQTRGMDSNDQVVEQLKTSRVSSGPESRPYPVKTTCRS